MTLFVLLGCGPSFDGSFELVDAANYHYRSTLDVSAERVTAGADLDLDWSALGTDLLGDPVDPTVDVTHVTLIAFPGMSESDVEAAAADDTLLQSDTSVLALLETDGRTRAALSDFGLGFTSTFDPAEWLVDADATWLLRATTGLLQTRMLRFLRLVPSGGAVEVALTSDSASLAFTVDLSTLEPYRVPATDTAWTADWSTLTRHANGNPIALDTVDGVQLGRLDVSLAALEADFVHLESLAAALYEADVPGTRTVDSRDLRARDGAAWDGFRAGELWVLALRCSTCVNPAPPFVTVIEVR